MKVFEFEDLPNAPLIVDAIYEGGQAPNLGSDPLARLLPGVGNQGGFRAAGAKGSERLVVLYSSSEDHDWPDNLDPTTGRFIYYGDNKTPGHELHDTARGGNSLLRRVYGALHAAPPNRDSIPPFLVFQKSPTKKSNRSVQFKGIAVPGYPGLPSTSDLVAVWKITAGERFQNYQSVLTVLDVPIVERNWLNIPTAGIGSAPKAWKEWVTTGVYRPLIAEPTRLIRSIDEQTPRTVEGIGILRLIWEHFRERPTDFEAYAAEIFRLHDRRVVIDGLTRASMDGGRDAFGRYMIGLQSDPVFAEFSLEAKCYAPPLPGVTANSVGVREIARLISRIRHREFGVLVTTSFIAKQAYEEVREDRHPIILISGRDMVDILVGAGFHSVETVKEHLKDF